MLLQPEHAAQAERHVKAAKAAIKWFGLWYGRYPYPTITVVDPALGAARLGRHGVPDVHHRRDVGSAQPLAARPGAACRRR